MNSPVDADAVVGRIGVEVENTGKERQEDRRDSSEPEEAAHIDKLGKERQDDRRDSSEVVEQIVELAFLLVSHDGFVGVSVGASVGFAVVLPDGVARALVVYHCYAEDGDAERLDLAEDFSSIHPR